MSGYYHMPLQGQHDQQHAEPSAFRPSRAEDWEPYRDIIAHLYNTMKLKDVMTEMQMTYNFKATEKQYKTQLKKWNLDTKYIKASEYMAMLQIMREREAQDPSKQTRFILRGRPVDPKDIARFEKRHQKKGTLKEGELAELQEPVEDLIYHTPSPEPTGYAYTATSDYGSTSSYATTSAYDTSSQYAYSYGM
ncbi:hypothetical protein QC762_600850 [Podospora pseudocomata]|uniref:Clr5 domain-containing protein n=2 Tax=Podospora TaxID=5144 RepID=A0ABR0G7K2_9PEZI|nr:hypothetical protein QC762_600850 [Podospora pseudocomata]KAK4671365.1 hypothetical protein QC764_600850 [Podospora pseudoanserina]